MSDKLEIKMIDVQPWRDGEIEAHESGLTIRKTMSREEYEKRYLKSKPKASA